MPSENVAASSTPALAGDRRTRKRAARRNALLALAADLVEERGPDGLTMAALAEAADHAPSSLYTYFPSRSALLSALQQQALEVLGAVADDALASWDAALTEAGADAAPAALARLLAFSRLFLSAPDHHPREFRLQQRLLVTEGVADAADAATVVPAAMAVLDVPRRLLAAAVDQGALRPHQPVADPLDEPLDGALVRTFAWVVALNGALLVDGLATGIPTTGARLGEEITDALLRGWGADPATLATARTLDAGLAGPAADRPGRPS
ncbi:TetR family transcriptional regulator [Iamia sp. SCSIO 61187]|uniref:TetR family transcriptional regulator n=1 Tax=Iamia sp. SCSIO 61187 TaxID=2722752 RepID=UPI001C6391E3|nr:TetR family transcriptional regulator [Iamia sp. SCSIO 61187]QYG91426.1 TetR family transcriptional regulator [Iamia sp. SCSIO 61187]